MNNARIWTVVSPTVGVPVFFLALMFTSLFIHYHVLTTTEWFGDFWKGASAQAPIEAQETPATTVAFDDTTK